MISLDDFAPEKFVFNQEIKSLNFGQFDMGSVLYHANYLPICETARENFLVDLGTSYGSLMHQGYHLPIIHLEQKFLKPLLYQAHYNIDLYVLDLTKTKIKFGHLIKSSNDSTPVNLTITLHTCVKIINDAFKVSPIPDDIENLIRKKIKTDHA